MLTTATPYWLRESSSDTEFTIVIIMHMNDIRVPRFSRYLSGLYTGVPDYRALPQWYEQLVHGRYAAVPPPDMKLA